jgi:putative endonuclease
MNILKVLTEKRKTGNVGEDAAARYLRKHGYKILERNYAELDAEIDIIAKNREYYVFVEVKTRTLGHQSPKEPRPASSVTPDKQKKIITVAKWYLGTVPKGRKIRFDIVEVYLDEKREVQRIMHLENAFNYNTSRGM